MDVLILVFSNPLQIDYWQRRIQEALYGNMEVVGVYEEWPNGAGNGLGTLFAFEEAQRTLGRNLLHSLKDGAAVAVYHTAGSGKRLFPLTAVERNNKPAVKLPCDASDGQMTIMEAVVKQSLQILPYRRGRLSVFWGDQLFFPEQIREPVSHISVAAQKKPFPSFETWHEERWDQYGVIGSSSLGDPLHLDKVDYQTAYAWTKDEIALSLGSFSLSAEMLGALLVEFAPELGSKTGKMDVEPHLFMPMTLPETLYLELMVRRGYDLKNAFEHYLRIRRFLDKFNLGDPGYSIDDIGHSGKWWDFGSLVSYYHSLIRLREEPVLYNFLIGKGSHDPEGLHTDGRSILINCKIKSGKIQRSVLYGVECDHIDVREALVLNAKAPEISCDKGILYHADSVRPIVLHRGEVRTDLDLFDHSPPLVIKTTLDRDGKEDWHHRILDNPYSYAELENLIRLHQSGTIR